MSIYAGLDPKAALAKWYQLRNTPPDQLANLSPEEQAEAKSPGGMVTLANENPAAWKLVATGTPQVGNQRTVFNPNTGQWDTKDVHGLWSHPETWAQLALGGAFGGAMAAPLIAGAGVPAGATTAAGGTAAGGTAAAGTAAAAAAPAAAAGTAAAGSTLSSTLLPLALQGAGSIVGGIVSKKAQDAAAQRSPEEQAALAGEQSAATTLGTSGQSLIGQGRDTLAGPINYYRTLLNGNRAAMANATAAPRTQIQEGIRGAQANIQRLGLRGAARDVASADLNRQGASQISGLTTGVQPAAASALTSIGGGQLQTGGSMVSGSGNLFGNMLGQGYANRVYSRQQGAETGNKIGGFIADIGKYFAKPQARTNVGFGAGLYPVGGGGSTFTDPNYIGG
jgi:hypothetical protein